MNPEELGKIQQLIGRGAMFVANHSGGKDSQAMMIALHALVPRRQLVVVHAHLGRAEWAGAVEHIHRYSFGLPVHVCQSRRDLLEMTEERGMFPSPQQRQCTSDLKRGPIERTIRDLVGRRKIRKEASWNLVVNCMGMRAEESPGRKRLATFKRNDRNSKAGREWYDWLPIHHLTKDQVFEVIRSAGQEPHPVYALGMSRFSCVFCIMSSEADLKTAARLATERPELLNDPHLYRKYVELEGSTGQVMLMPTKRHGRRTLQEVTGVPLLPTQGD